MLTSRPPLLPDAGIRMQRDECGQTAHEDKITEIQRLSGAHFTVYVGHRNDNTRMSAERRWCVEIHQDLECTMDGWSYPGEARIGGLERGVIENNSRSYTSCRFGSICYRKHYSSLLFSIIVPSILCNALAAFYFKNSKINRNSWTCNVMTQEWRNIQMCGDFSNANMRGPISEQNAVIYTNRSVELNCFQIRMWD